MDTLTISRARAVADLTRGEIVATVEVAAAPERVFPALASPEITEWWVRSGVFDTRTWSGDVQVGGQWRASGMGGGRPYVLEGQFLVVDPPKQLVHTWRTAGAPGAPTTVAYLLESLPTGTRITLRHVGFTSRDTCANTAIGWETSFECLAARLAGR